MTTAKKSHLTAYELNCLGFREVYLVRIDIYERNGHTFNDRVSDELVRHFWKILGQDAENLDRTRVARIPRRGFRITFKAKDPVYLPHVSETAKFDFYCVPSGESAGLDIKLLVLQCTLIGQNEE